MGGPCQAALARSGDEHPTLLAVYVEQARQHAAGLQKSDRSSSRALVLFRKPPRLQTQTLSHLSLLHTAQLGSTSAVILTKAPLAVLYILFCRIEASSALHTIHPQPCKTECYGPGVLVIFLVLSLVTSCLVPAPESLAGETTHLCWRSSTCSRGRLARKGEGRIELTPTQAGLAVCGVLRRALRIERCRAQGQAGPQQPRVNLGAQRAHHPDGDAQSLVRLPATPNVPVERRLTPATDGT